MTAHQHRSRPVHRFEGGPSFLATVGALAVLFGGLGAYELANPDGAVLRLSQLNTELGGVPLLAPDVQPWRYATVAAMITLSAMCAMLVIDLRRNHPVLVPAALFKVLNAGLWLSLFSGLRQPVFLAAGVLDLVLVAVLVVVTQRAWRRLPATAAATGVRSSSGSALVGAR